MVLLEESEPKMPNSPDYMYVSSSGINLDHCMLGSKSHLMNSNEIFTMKRYCFQNMCPFPKIRTYNHTTLSFLAKTSANISFQGDI